MVLFYLFILPTGILSFVLCAFFFQCSKTLGLGLCSTYPALGCNDGLLFNACPTLGLCSTYLALGLCSTYLYFLSFFNVLNCYTLIPLFSLIFSLMRNMKFQFIILIFFLLYFYSMFDGNFRKCFYSF